MIDIEIRNTIDIKSRKVCDSVQQYYCNCYTNSEYRRKNSCSKGYNSRLAKKRKLEHTKGFVFDPFPVLLAFLHFSCKIDRHRLDIEG